MKKSAYAAAYGLLALATTDALATDGYFSHGYGVQSQGIAGVGIALPLDALAPASNPAGLAFVGDRIDVGLSVFRPVREAAITGNAFPGVDGVYDGNETQAFLIPEFGYARVISPSVSVGLAVYGNGGMNTDYSRAVPLLGSTPAGVDLSQLLVVPTVAWKVSPRHTVGVSLQLAYQRFEAHGLQNFDNPGYTLYPGYVTDKGHDSAVGIGAQLGWLGEISENVRVGATYKSRTHMSKFDDYRGLFAQAGDFDIPASYGLGIAVKASPKLTLAADLQRIEYSSVASVGNLSLTNLFAGKPLGSSQGPGFGWRDVTATKLGAQYAWRDGLSLRIGYNHSSQPIRSGETLFNILAPGVVEDHVTAGATWRFADRSELSVSFMHAFENSVSGQGSIPPGFPPAGFGGGEADLSMYQDSIGVAYAWVL